MKLATRMTSIAVCFAGVANARLKRTVDDLNEVPEPYRSLYEQSDSGYTLVIEIEGTVDETSLDTMRRARDHEKTGNKTLKEKIADLELQLADAQRANSRGKGSADIEALEASYKKQIKELQESAAKTEGSLKTTISGLTVGAASAKLAADLFIVPSAMEHHVSRRLVAEIDEDGRTVTRVLDKDGTVSAMSLEDLEKELRKTPGWEPFLKTKGGSGGGGHGKPGGAKTFTKENATDMTEAERAEMLKNDPEQFKRLFGR